MMSNFKAQKPEMVFTKNEQIMEDLGLPKAQRRVLKYLMMGLSTEDIADHLYLTAKGVKYQLTALYKRLGYSSRAQLQVGLCKIGWQIDASVKEPRRVPKKRPESELLVGGSSNVPFR